MLNRHEWKTQLRDASQYTHFLNGSETLPVVAVYHSNKRVRQLEQIICGTEPEYLLFVLSDTLGRALG